MRNLVSETVHWKSFCPNVAFLFSKFDRQSAALPRKLADRCGDPAPKAAYAFINDILRAEVHGQIASEIKYPCSNEVALGFILEEDRNNASVFPSKETLARCEIAVYDAVENDLQEKALSRLLRG